MERSFILWPKTKHFQAAWTQPDQRKLFHITGWFAALGAEPLYPGSYRLNRQINLRQKSKQTGKIKLLRVTMQPCLICGRWSQNQLGNAARSALFCLPYLRTAVLKVLGTCSLSKIKLPLSHIYWVQSFFCPGLFLSIPQGYTSIPSTVVWLRSWLS